MIRKSCTYKKIKTIVALSVIVGENWAGPKGRGSRPIPFKFRTTDYLSDTFWIFPLKKDWLVSIRLSPLFLVNLHKNTLSNLGWLGQDILPTSINWDAIHLYPRDECFWLFMMPLPSLHICASRDFFFADSPILSCADNISNQNGFRKVHLLLFNVQWDLDWDLRVLSQDWALKSAQIGKNGVQFPANFYVSGRLNKRTPAFVRMLACHIKLCP